MKNKEWNECWFDAKEDFTGTDFSVVSGEVGKHQEKEDTVGLRGEVTCFKVMYLNNGIDIVHSLFLSASFPVMAS